MEWSQKAPLDEINLLVCNRSICNYLNGLFEFTRKNRGKLMKKIVAILQSRQKLQKCMNDENQIMWQEKLPVHSY